MQAKLNDVHDVRLEDNCAIFDSLCARKRDVNIFMTLPLSQWPPTSSHTHYSFTRRIRAEEDVPK